MGKSIKNTLGKIAKWLVIFVIASLASLVAIPFKFNWFIAELISVLSGFFVTFIPIVIDFTIYELNKLKSIKR